MTTNRTPRDGDAPASEDRCAPVLVYDTLMSWIGALDEALSATTNPLAAAQTEA